MIMLWILVTFNANLVEEICAQPSATSMHENHDELSAIRQHLSQTPTEGAGALPGKDALAGSLAGKDALAGAGALADEGAMSATSIHEDDDELSAIRQHLSHAPTSSILPVLSKPAVSWLHT